MDIDGYGELDFALWRRDRFGFLAQPPPQLILGEAKSFDRFQPRDAERMLALRNRLGQGTICFATLRDDLEDEERRLLNAVTDEPGAGRPLLMARRRGRRVSRDRPVGRLIPEG